MKFLCTNKTNTRGLELENGHLIDTIIHQIKRDILFIHPIFFYDKTRIIHLIYIRFIGHFDQVEN